MRNFLIILTIVLFSFAPIRNTFAVGEDISVNVIPENPHPYDPVSVELSSYTNDLNRSLITWSVNGKVFLTGIGKNNIKFNLGENGTVADINVGIRTEDGTSITKHILIQATDIDLLWEAPDSFVPPFYRGKALPAREAFVKFVAIPNTNNFKIDNNTKNFVYTWKHNYENVPDSSGFQKDSILISMDYLNQEENVSVIAQSLSNQYGASAQMSITPFSPLLDFYKNSEINGVDYSYSLSDGYSLSGATTITAVPYFISPRSPRSPVLDYTWKLNGNEANADKNNINIQTTGKGNGIIDVLIDNNSTLYQTIKRSLSLSL